MTDEILKETAGKIGTPCYLFDLDEARGRAREVRAMLGERIGLCFAMKSNPFLAGALAPLVDRVECCSIGEFRIAVKENVPPEKILFSGVMKNEEEIAEVMNLFGSRCLYTAESPLQFRLLRRAAEERGIRIRVFLRLSSGNQFGMAFRDLKALYKEADLTDAVSIEGIHFFSGTQKHMAAIRKEFEALGGHFQELREEGREVKELEYGPGLPVRYFENDRNDFTDEDVRETVRLAEALCVSSVTFEMGRFLASSCGTYLTSIMDIKAGSGEKDPAYCITDGGIHQIQYDGQFRGMFTPEIRVVRDRQVETEEDPKTYTICGSLCTTNDVLCGQFHASGLKTGDLLAFGRAGAYSAFEGMALFLSHDLPAVALISKEEGVRLVRDMQPTWIFNTERKEK